MIDKSKRKATVEQAGSVVVVRMTGGPDCLWLNMYLDTASWLMVCDSDIGSYAYRWGISASRNETFLAFCCRWLSDADWLLRKCIGERHVSKEFLRDKAEAVLREMIIEYNAGDDDFDEDCLDDMMGFAAGYDSDPKAWALAIQTYADARSYDLPEEWYECIEEDYTPWQKRFAEICREVIVPELENLCERGRDEMSAILNPWQYSCGASAGLGYASLYMSNGCYAYFPRKENTKMNRLEKLKAEAAAGAYSKIVLGIRMPDGSKEIIINDKVAEKVAYISQKYDVDLKMNGAPIAIEEYLLIKE